MSSSRPTPSHPATGVQAPDAPELRVDRAALTVTRVGENDEDRYWWSRTPLERIEDLEHLP